MEPVKVDLVCGHWAVMDALAQRGVRRFERAVYECVSQCGVAMHYARAMVAANRLPATCWACRPGVNSQPGRVVVPGQYLTEHLKLWETGMNVRSNLKGKAAVADWDSGGFPAAALVLSLGHLGATFGWSLWVRDCHEQPAPRDATVVRVKGYHESQRRIELAVRPVTGRYIFEVDITWPQRRDTPFREVSDSITEGIKEMQRQQDATGRGAAVRAADVPAPEVVAVPPAAEVVEVTPPPPPVPAGLFGGMNLERLLLMRNGMDRVLKAGEESQTLATARADAEARMTGAAAAAAVAAETARLKRKTAAAAAAEEKEVGGRLAALREGIAAAEHRLGELARLVPTCDQEAADAERAAAEADTDRQLVQIELDEIAASERELEKSLASAADVLPLLPLLAAFAKMK